MSRNIRSQTDMAESVRPSGASSTHTIPGKTTLVEALIYRKAESQAGVAADAGAPAVARKADEAARNAPARDAPAKDAPPAGGVAQSGAATAVPAAAASAEKGAPKASGSAPSGGGGAPSGGGGAPAGAIGSEA